MVKGFLLGLLLSFASLSWFCAVKHYQVSFKQMEVDIAYKTVELNLMAQHVNCTQAQN